MTELASVGLVGCGYWGTNLCRVLAQHPSVSLRWVCDREPGALARAARIAPRARLATELNSLLNDEVEALVIATPVNSHYGLALAALEAGKHVLVEKPLCSSVMEAEQLCFEAHRRRRVLMVGHTFLYNGAVRRVKAIIDSGELGEIRYVFSRRLNLGIVRQDVDVLWNLAPHDISILDYWIGRPVRSLAAVGNCFLQPGIVDVVFAHLTFEGNIAGHIQVSWLDPSKVRQATVVGSRRMLFYDDMSPDARIVVYDKGIDINSLDENLGRFETFAQHQLAVRAGDAWLPKVELREPLLEQVEDFVDSIREGRPPVADSRRGLRVVSILEMLSQVMCRYGPDGT